MRDGAIVSDFDSLYFTRTSFKYNCKMKNRIYSFLVFGIVAITLLTLSIFSPDSAAYPYLIRSSSPRFIISLLILASGFLSLLISYRIGMQQCWYIKGVKGAIYLTPIATGVVLGGIHIFTYNLLNIHPLEGFFIDLIPLFYNSLLLAILFNFVLITTLIWLLKRFLIRDRFPSAIYWICSALIAFLEPLIIVNLLGEVLEYNRLIQPLFIMELLYLIGIISFAFLRYRGFLSMLLFRISEIVCFGVVSILLY